MNAKSVIHPAHKHTGRGTELLLHLIDAVCIGGSLCIYYFALGYRQSLAYVVLGIVAISLFQLLASALGMYRSRRLESIQQEASDIFKNWAITVSVIMAISFATKTTGMYSRLLTIPWLLSAPLIIILSRIIVRSVATRVRTRGQNSRRAAIVGADDVATRIASTIDTTPTLGLQTTGFYFDEDSGLVPRKGSINELITEARNGLIDHIYISLSTTSRETLDQLISSLADSTVSLFVVPDFRLTDLMHNHWTELNDMTVISVYDTPFSGVNGIVKRMEDLVLSLLIIPLILPFMGLIACFIKLTSKGPILFRQMRYGVGGQEIEVWKFRTMTVCESDEQFQQATKSDPRVTPVGKFLRRTSLDELPQFFNVLGGSMSVVGPRPHAVAQNEQYRTLISGYMLRHKIKPGISGWAQVHGWRGETDTLDKMQRRIDYDLEYIRHWSLWLDLKILFMTIHRVFRDKNAY